MNGCALHIFSAQSKNKKQRDVTILAQHMTVNTHGAPFQTNTKTFNTETAVECHSAHSSCRPSYSLGLLTNYTFDIFPAF